MTFFFNTTRFVLTMLFLYWLSCLSCMQPRPYDPPPVEESFRWTDYREQYEERRAREDLRQNER